jgi:hypothetical protein
LDVRERVQPQFMRQFLIVRWQLLECQRVVELENWGLVARHFEGYLFGRMSNTPYHFQDNIQHPSEMLHFHASAARGDAR